MKPYYSANGITLYQGDNREVLAALGLKAKDVALLWGDPPYGIDLETTYHLSPRKWSRIVGDDEQFDPKPWLEKYARVALWGGNHFADRLPPSSSWWTWDKREGGGSTINADCEHAWTSLGGPARLFSHAWRGAVRKSERETCRVHPTQKPVALAAWGFRQAKLKPGDLVLSPWLGSGPEAVAARDMGLRFIGIELVTEYLDACVNRLRQAPLPLVAPAPQPQQKGLDLSLDPPWAKR